MTDVATRQDMQTALERAKNSIVGNMFSRNDAQNTISQLRNGILQDLRELHNENQVGIRLAQNQHDQMIQRISSLQQQLSKLADQQAQTLTILQHLLEPNGALRRY